jgi:predicted RNA-binding Zn ribbon-like protein
VEERYPALELASTIRHDGNGGVADDLTTPEETARWLTERGGLLFPAEPGLFAGPGATGATGDPAAVVALAELHADVVALRQAVRALFAHAVRPGPPSPADAQRLLPVGEAVERLNAAAAREPVVPRLGWPEGAPPAARLIPVAPADPGSRVVAALARATVDFLTGPHRADLRACTAPRCVRYFVKQHGRQEWCKPSCGNRARAARHYRRHHGADEPVS